MNKAQRLKDELKDWYSSAEAKKALNCYHYELIRWAESGMITRVRDANRSFYLKKDVDNSNLVSVKGSQA